MDLNTIIQPLIVLGGSGIAGYACGYFLKKLAKIIMFVAGGIFTLLAVLQWQGILSVNWNILGQRLQEGALLMANKTQEIAGTVSGQVDGNTMIGGVGFVAGMIMGLRR